MSLEKDSYERIVENLHDGLYFVDQDRIITYWNKAAEQISGFAAEEVLGKSCSDNILTHVDSEGNRLCTEMCPLAATIADGTYRETEIYMHHKSGHRIPVSDSGSFQRTTDRRCLFFPFPLRAAANAVRSTGRPAVLFLVTGQRTLRHLSNADNQLDPGHSQHADQFSCKPWL